MLLLSIGMSSVAYGWRRQFFKLFDRFVSEIVVGCGLGESSCSDPPWPESRPHDLKEMFCKFRIISEFASWA